MGRQVFRTTSGVERSLSQSSFIGGDDSPAVAAQNSHVQLFNPTASGLQLIVNRIYARPSSATPTLRLTFHNAALTDLATTLGNKFLGASSPIGEVRSQANAGVLGTIIHFLRVPGTTAAEVILDSPIIVPAGLGIVLVSATQNEAVTASFEWDEIGA